MEERKNMNPFPLTDTKHTCRHGNSHKLLQMKSLFLILSQKKKSDRGGAALMRYNIFFFCGQNTYGSISKIPAHFLEFSYMMLMTQSWMQAHVINKLAVSVLNSDFMHISSKVVATICRTTIRVQRYTCRLREI